MPCLLNFQCFCKQLVTNDSDRKNVLEIQGEIYGARSKSTSQSTVQQLGMVLIFFIA